MPAISWSWSPLRLVWLLAILAPTAGLADPLPAELAAGYRFLVVERSAGGILYTATAGDLRNRQLPLSFYDSAAYWGEHVCASADCTVVDVFNPQTFTLLPRASNGGDLQTERVNTHNGINIYDGATWQIAVMLGSRINRLPIPSGQDAYALASNQNLLLRAGHSGESRHPVPAETRAVTNGPVFVYNGQRITEPRQAYSFRMLPRTWLSRDPFAETPYARLISATGLPPHDPAYQTGVISWTDWKPITGENAWAALIGPLQAAWLHFCHGNTNAHIPFQDLAVQNALAVLPTFAAMQSPLGGVFYAPAGTVANQGEQLVDPSFVAVENNISLYAGLQILRSTLETIRQLDHQLSPAERATIDEALWLCAAMIHGGEIGKERRTDGLLAFFKNFAWQGGEFVQGGTVDSTQVATRWQPSLSPKAVDVNTWGIAALGPATLDEWFGFGAAYRNWQQVKGWGAYGRGTTLWGVGFSDQDGNGIAADSAFHQGIISVEWTAGAITSVRAMIDYYRAVPPASPHHDAAQRFAEELRHDERSMLTAMEHLRVANYIQAGFNGTPDDYEKFFNLSSNPYLYANKRYFIPFGWYANPIPSTCATAWMLMVADAYNPFLPGGGLR